MIVTRWSTCTIVWDSFSVLEPWAMSHHHATEWRGWFIEMKERWREKKRQSNFCLDFQSRRLWERDGVVCNNFLKISIGALDGSIGWRLSSAIIVRWRFSSLNIQSISAISHCQFRIPNRNNNRQKIIQKKRRKSFNRLVVRLRMFLIHGRCVEPLRRSNSIAFRLKLARWFMPFDQRPQSDHCSSCLFVCSSAICIKHRSRIFFFVFEFAIRNGDVQDNSRYRNMMHAHPWRYSK